MKKQVFTLMGAALIGVQGVRAQCSFTLTGITANTSSDPISSFTANMIGSPPSSVYYYWSFGDGNYGGGVSSSITHTYCSAGNYNVVLFAFDSLGLSCSQSVSTTINVVNTILQGTGISVNTANDPSISFTANVNNPNNYPLTYQWDFDYPNGVIGNGNPVSYNYTANGNYVVSVNVSGGGCVLTQTTAISVNGVSSPTPCAYSPTINILSNNDPTFTFGVISNPTPPSYASYLWYIYGPNSTTLSTTTPTLSYNLGINGTYSVCVSINDSTCSGSFISCTSVNVSNGSDSSLTCSLDLYVWADSLNPATWYYNYTPSANQGVPPYTIIGYFWDFGDGNTSTQAFPSYTYATPGTYTVCLSVTYVDANSDTCVATNCGLVYKLLNNGHQDNVLSGNAKYLYPFTTGIKEATRTSFKAYPNPAQNQINLEFAQTFNGQIEIIDITGRTLEIIHIKDKKDIQIDISSLLQGMYYIKAKDETKGETTKPIIKN